MASNDSSNDAELGSSGESDFQRKHVLNSESGDSSPFFSPSVKEPPKGRNVSRRQSLKGIVGGLGALGIPSLLSRKGLADGTVEITTVEHKGEALEKAQVPRSWYSQVKAAEKARKRFNRIYSDVPGYREVHQQAAESAVGDLYEHKLVAHVDNVDVAKRKLPSEIDGIPVEVTKKAEESADSHQNDDCSEERYSMSCVAGGSYLTSDEGCFTATGLAEYNGDNYLMTCGHTMGDCGDDYYGVTVYTGPGKTDEVGDVYIYNWDYDWALVDPTEVNGISNEILNESKYLHGHATSEGCDMLISNYDETRHMGITTGQTKGWLDAKVTKSFCCCPYDSVEYLKHGTEAADGDSGGPHYYDTGSSNLALLGLHSSHDTYSGSHTRSYGPAAYAINNNSSIEFGSGSSPC